MPAALLSKTILCTSIKHDVDKLLVKVTCYNNDGIPIVVLVNVIFEIPVIVRYIHNKKNSKTTKMFTILNGEYVGSQFYSYKRKDNIRLSDDSIQKVLL